MIQVRDGDPDDAHASGCAGTTAFSSRATSASTIIVTRPWKSTSGFQPKLGARLGRIADEQIHFGGADEARVELDVLLPVEPDVPEGDFHEFAHGMRLAGGDDVIVGAVLLQHQPHGLDVVAGEAPVAARVQVAERQAVRTDRA